ncbi:MAG: DciA family protein [Promicromonosporaceae bacterium]|nr:DciA family protein [Promicromonosporaceae bacterium]
MTDPGQPSASSYLSAALNRAKSIARGRGLLPGVPRGSRPRPKATYGRGNSRDPRLLGDTLQRLFDEQGWAGQVGIGAVVDRWAEVVGRQVADHCQPEDFEETTLTVRADSTAWATQLRLLTPTILRRIDETFSPGLITKVRVLGPSGRTFKRGPLSVPGRGVRDTFG